MKKLFGFLMIFLATGLTMFFSNPKIDKHKEAVFQVLSSVILEEKEKISISDNVQSNILKKMDQESLDNFVKPFVDYAVSIKDYKVFSITYIDLGDAVYTVGVGVFGKVFIFPKLKTKVRDNIQQFI
ncbi:MAG TPA: hypothetical protein VLZ83_03530 [Edaphocola sp.]|nr:hypothetical protein [Edaphocola sp.]